MTDSRFFKTSGPFTLEELSNIANSKVIIGDPQLLIRGVATLENAKEGEVSFLSNPKYISALKTSRASSCIIGEEHQNLVPTGMAILLSSNPYASYAAIVAKFHPPLKVEPKISNLAVIHKAAQIKPNCYIGEFAVIGENVELGEGSYIGSNVTIADGVVIGKNCRILPNSTISHAIVGDNCIFHSGVRIGQDGFGYAPHQYGITKVEQVGRVVIGNHVEIGANTCIDRGAIDDTVIGDHTKIDNLVQIGHNVKIGSFCFIVAQSGIAGSTIIEDKVMLGGQSGIAGHVHIGNNARIAAQSGVMSDVEKGAVLGGSPALPIKQWHRMTAALKRIATKTKNEQI